MGRFVKAKAKASGTAAAAAKPSKVTGALMQADPIPLGAVSTIGRVTFIFGYTPGVLD